jgi:hypothetical protein
MYAGRRTFYGFVGHSPPKADDVGKGSFAILEFPAEAADDQPVVLQRRVVDVAVPVLDALGGGLTRVHKRML